MEKVKGKVFPNAGLPVFESWQPTLKAILGMSSEIIITDYTEEAISLAHTVVKGELEAGGEQALKDRVLSEPVMNPLRRPLSCQGRDNLLPSCSNGFMFTCSVR